MHVTVNPTTFSCFTGPGDIQLELPDESVVADLRDLLAERYPTLRAMASVATFLVNHRSVTLGTPLADGDDVLMLQVLGGG